MEQLTTSIKDLMAAQVITIDVSDSLAHAKEILKDNEIHHLPVTKEGEFVGILSSNDINKIDYMAEFVEEKASEESFFEVVDIEELMTKCLMVLGEESTLRDAVELFSQNQFQALPVVHGSEIVGIVTTKDVFSYLLNNPS